MSEKELQKDGHILVQTILIFIMQNQELKELRQTKLQIT